MAFVYNARIIKYPVGGCQLRLYSRPVGCSYDGLEAFPETGLFCDDSTGKYYSRDDLTYNPFTDEYEYITNVETAEHSKRVSYNRTKNRIYYLARSNIWDWFVTLTFDPEKVDSFNYSLCVEYLSKWLNNCRRKAPCMKHLVVPEQHKSGRFHFHGLFSCCDELGFIDSGKRVKGTGETIYNIGSYRLGFTTATRVIQCDRVSKYITKYVTKELCAVAPGKRRYWASRNLDEASCVDLFLEGSEKSTFVDYVREFMKHKSRVSGLDISIDYYELSEDFDISVLDNFNFDLEVIE